jgi:hypothetical protein
MAYEWAASPPSHLDMEIQNGPSLRDSEYQFLIFPHAEARG